MEPETLLIRLSMNEHATKFPRATWQGAGTEKTLRLAGEWTLGSGEIKVEGYEEGDWPKRFVTDGIGHFDSRLPGYLMSCFRAKKKHHEGSLSGLPNNLRELMELALKVPDHHEAEKQTEHSGRLAALGTKMTSVWIASVSLVEFIGETVLSLGRFFTGKARFRKSDFRTILQECGAEALPIVALITFLIGMILAFVGNAQLANFGAGIYVADLVGIATVREMGVVMTAIILSGRTGASFAAHLGSMNANEEIDALRTFGFHPFDFLVLPRVLALILMMPLLTVYANTIGILGGMLVAWTAGITPALFWTELLSAISPQSYSLGVIKSVFFGATIAIAGCMQGMRSGKSSSAVGQAATRSVVVSITAIVVLDSAFAILFTLLDI
jgi:phospholipid/cholesterol/gamma-HCH transport system permease protein